MDVSYLYSQKVMKSGEVGESVWKLATNTGSYVS